MAQGSDAGQSMFVAGAFRRRVANDDPAMLLLIRQECIVQDRLFPATKPP
jgi:hypothetical protein